MCNGIVHFALFYYFVILTVNLALPLGMRLSLLFTYGGHTTLCQWYTSISVALLQIKHVHVVVRFRNYPKLSNL